MLSQSVKPISPRKTISVLPRDIKLTKNGIEDYNWPVSHQDLLDFGQSLEHTLSKFLREYPDQEQVLAYKIAAKNYVTSVCACYQGELLTYRAAEQNLEIDLPDDWNVWGNIFENAPPPLPAYLDALQTPQKEPTLVQRLLKPSNWAKAFKKVRFSESGPLQVDGLLLGIPPENPEVIVSTQRLALITRHAQTIDQKVYLAPSLRRFSQITNEELSRRTDQSPSPINQKIIEIIQETYAQYDLTLANHNRAYLLSVLKRSILLIKIHMERLASQSNLPQALWTGTGGHIWDLMLRCEVKRRGGVVVAHDHGGGVPHLDHPEKGWVEMWACDEFVTYSTEQVKTFEQFMHSWPNLDQDLPKIRTLSKTKKTPDIQNFPKFLINTPEIKSVRVFSTIYSSEEGRGLPIYPHIPYIDWQARLLSYLKTKGYEVSFKPHPDSRLSAPPSYNQDLGIEIVEKSLERMDDTFDLYIFDLSNTSVLQTALMTNKPILIADFSVMNWRTDAFDLFKQRCGYIKGFYEGSRMCVDWNELSEQIQSAANKSNNHDFALTYYF